MPHHRLGNYRKDRKADSTGQVQSAASEENRPSPVRSQDAGEPLSEEELQSITGAISAAAGLEPADGLAGCLGAICGRIARAFSGRRATETTAFREILNDCLRLTQLLDSMDPDTRQIITWKLLGYSNRRIAKELGIPWNDVARRYTQGVRDAVRKALLSRETRA